MNGIIGEARAACYTDAASLLVIILLLLLSERIRREKTGPLHIFFVLCCHAVMACLAMFAYNMMYAQPAPWCRTAALISHTLGDAFILAIVSLWVVFVQTKLFGPGRNLSAVRVIRISATAVFGLLTVINLFTGILYTVGDDNRIEAKILYHAMAAAVFLLFCSAAVSVWYFDRKTAKIRFLRISPMVISISLSLIPQYFTPYDTGLLGLAIGITLLYFSMISEIRFSDEESGLYNRGYLAYLFDLAFDGKNDARSVLILEADGNLPAFFEILRAVLHQDGDVIRTEEKKFMMFSSTDSRSTVQYLSSLVEEAVNARNEADPDHKIRMTARCRIRNSEEDAFSFLRRVVDEKDTGGTMRGIVSMMSELDRLDRELELAADIQLSMLPMNFPPFPDRREFDLYASMTPAREVGGDFYDFFLIDEDHLGLVIADVSGKGIPAALFMMVSKTLIKNQMMTGCDPARALEHVNLQLAEKNSAMMFVTVWLAVIELSTGKGLVCNAGHEKPALRRSGELYGLLAYKHNMFLGVNKKAKYQNREFQLAPGDSLFVYTDGVPEAANGKSEMFGGEGLVRTLNENPDADPEATVHHVHDAVDRFAAGAEQFDDITMLCFRYNGPQPQLPG